jgi:hypothetical protein
LWRFGGSNVVSKEQTCRQRSYGCEPSQFHGASLTRKSRHHGSSL